MTLIAAGCSASSFDAVAAASAAGVVDLTAVAGKAALSEAPPAVSLITSTPGRLNATLRCACGETNRCGTSINRRNVCKISTQLWERLQRAFGARGDAFVLHVMDNAANAPQQCETCTGGKEDLKREANDAKQRQEEESIGLDRVLYFHERNAKRTSFKVQGEGDLRGGKVGPGQYAIVPVVWLSMWRLRMQNMGSAAFSEDRLPLSYEPLYCSCEKGKRGLVKSQYAEGQIIKGTALPKMVFKEQGSALACPFEVRR